MKSYLSGLPNPDVVTEKLYNMKSQFVYIEMNIAENPLANIF
ncbi:hypothetical protein [Methanobrevibacter sp.]